MDKDGKWITVNGTHVFLEKGKTIEDAFKDYEKSGNLLGYYKAAKPIKDLKDAEFDYEKFEADIGTKENLFKNWARVYPNKVEADIEVKAKTKEEALQKFAKKYPFVYYDAGWGEPLENAELKERNGEKHFHYSEENMFTLDIEEYDGTWYISVMRYLK